MYRLSLYIDDIPDLICGIHEEWSDVERFLLVGRSSSVTNYSDAFYK
jgi:hypothetical protein